MIVVHRDERRIVRENVKGINGKPLEYVARATTKCGMCKCRCSGGVGVGVGVVGVGVGVVETDAAGKRRRVVCV